ncbi:UDP-2,3-diacylglucosamine diphosphatase [Candidatus Enterovibrio altilux]|uniref:UDP-2,3-diacylglucosamine hydrolase n=1 Tax=Candidatus Enterovibrio altilux TaxID=1927128 RepID=A0A291B6I3_9GAMM|nr:UDP-2,3-diacylglucosamine diphosphatase [Candidatus Enterovibrio luxaltus]ATF08601.1 UDP-2,3-diacylglucosamine diphosphatase [Candidatus Enterovibrio luxaltus]
MTILFISDLHLSPSHPAITDCFCRFLNEEALHASMLYILGDLFEVWIGDDDNTPLHRKIASALKTLSEHGVPIYFIHGNRDFMIGKYFAKESSMILLPEHTVIDLFGKQTLIMHGDTLCIHDEDYQRYRRKVRNIFTQWLFLRLPLSYRKNIGEKIRKSSVKSNQQKTEDIIDVDTDEVSRLMKVYGVTQIIHGHTHRPYVHTVSMSTNTEFTQRIVLGDWYTQSSVLSCTEDGCQLASHTLGY